MTDELFVPFKFRTTVQLSPVEIHGNIADRIRDKLKQQLEGVCSRFGFVQPNSIDVVRRSAGVLLKAHFNGHVKFEVACKARVCNPVYGMILAGVVVNKNQLGILADCKIQISGRDTSVLDVIIPYRTAGMQSDVDLESFGIGDKIYFEVVGKRSQVHDKKISVIGRGVNPPSAPMAVADNDADVLDDAGPDADEYFEDLEEVDIADVRGGADEDAEVDEEGEDKGDNEEDEDKEEKDEELEGEGKDDQDSESDGFSDTEEEEEELEEDLDDMGPEDDFEDEDTDDD